MFRGIGPDQCATATRECPLVPPGLDLAALQQHVSAPFIGDRCVLP